MQGLLQALKGLFSTKDGAPRSLRAMLLALAAFSVTPEGQAAIAGAAGPWAPFISIILAALAGYTAVGEPNPEG